MAKGSAMGLWRGKKGSSVFYKITNSNNAQKQGIRERVYEVANPQSTAQVSQRQKLLPAQRLYGQLADIIKRSWQGVDYGGLGTQQFMKYALSMSTGIPFVDKDDDRTIPGAYQISKGTITEITTSVVESDFHITSLQVDQELTGNSTWGEVSQSLINYNDIKDGDQLTFIVCDVSSAQVEDAVYKWEYASIIIDTSSTTILSDVNENFKLLQITFDQEPTRHFTLSAKRNIFGATAVIASRLNGTKFERSTSKLTVDTQLLAYWFTAERRAQATASYKKASGATSTNWPVEDSSETVVTRFYDVILAATVNGTASGGGRGLEAGTTATLTATAASGYSLFGWYKDDELVSTLNPYSFVVSAATAGEYEARFQQL